MQSFYEVLEESEVGDLHTLASVTGVEYDTIKKIVAGDVLPDDAHIRAILKALPYLNKKTLLTHKAPSPDTVEFSRKGAPPENHSLMLLPGKDIQVGDLIPYIHRGKQKYAQVGTTWIKIKSLKMAGYLIEVEFEGEGTIRVREEQHIRIARPHNQ